METIVAVQRRLTDPRGLTTPIAVEGEAEGGLGPHIVASTGGINYISSVVV
ncbi:hypothetical protein L195_g016862 [Trifolium pratense]|uniref:Uncharacterized protein n=1 Tax=Trifolium pratense TaxID=57577 RepID=A0A2K3MSH6_TRIPR|nr:hypothetical protein L195_g016862 [Trifolium pratense]